MGQPRSPETKAKISATKQSIALAKNGPMYEQREMGYVTPCWIWQRQLNEKRYPNTRWRRRLYEREFGPYPKGAHLHHLCHVKSCVNPDHQFALTRAEHVALHQLERECAA
jgi:HNH endonuclease